MGLLSSVSILKTPKADVKKLLDNIGFQPEECDVLVIKPNLCCSRTGDTGYTTDSSILEELFKIYQGLAKEIIVAESNGTNETADRIFSVTGINDLCKKYGVKTVNLSRDELIPVDRDYSILKGFKCPRTILKADVLINVPKMKTHHISTVSLGLKNMMGIIPGHKGIYHPNLAEAIADILSIRQPTLNILDGLVAFESHGAFRGKAKIMNLLMASTDVVSLDTVACRIMGINPIHVEHIVKAAYYGYGEYAEKKIEIFGEKIENVRNRFEVY